MEYYRIEENGIHMVLGITDDRRVKLLHFGASKFDETRLCRNRESFRADNKEVRPQMLDEAFQLVQVELAGYNRPYENHGRKYVGTAPGYLYKLAGSAAAAAETAATAASGPAAPIPGIDDTTTPTGRRITIHLIDDEVTHTAVDCTFQFYTGTKLVRCTNTITNIGDETQVLEYLGAFSYTGIEKEGDSEAEEKMRIRVPYNGWQKEVNWKEYRFSDLWMEHTQPALPQRTSNVLEFTNTGNWSTKHYLPIGYIENTEAHTSLFWQIEHNGSWHYEIGDMHGHFYVSVSGPTERESHWFKMLAPGESFTSVPVAVGAARDDFEEAIGELTKYRRLIRRENADNETLPVIFNDYMNCLFGDPTTAKELPLIDAAADCGCEYFVIDAGWYSAGPWWDSVGEWKESRERFPEGIAFLSEKIREKGMIPGVWLEPEVMGINCDLAKNAPDDWFFCRHGRRVYDRSRYQLDYRNPEVRAYIDGVIDRLVRDYGIGYIKIDYNIEPGFGTELHADSPGQGLLEHEQAYLDWLDGVFARYPDLVLENCSSGGMRMDYALLSKYSIQSTSDQEDYVNYATISANAPTAVTPEQAAVWSYPVATGDEEETIYNMVNAMLLRIHQSGHLAELSPSRRALVKEGIACYKTMRPDIRTGVPFWPCGLASNRSTWLASGIKNENRTYLAIWKRNAESSEYSVPLACAFSASEPVDPADIRVRCIYPSGSPVEYVYDASTCELRVTFDKPVMARLFCIEKG